MNMSAIITQLAVLFIVIAVGYAANKWRVLSGDSNKLLSRLVINITLPCTILSSVLSGEITATGRDAAIFMLLTAAAFVIFFLLAAPLPNLLRVPAGDRGLFRFMAMFGNVGFMGFPVIQSIFGTGSLFYVTIFNIVFSVVCFSIGILMISGKGNKIRLMTFVNPTMIVSILAVILFYLKLTVPAFISDSIKLVGQLTTPSVMLLIGSTLAMFPIKEVFTNLRIYPLIVVKLLIMPIITWLVMRLFVSDPLMLGVFMVLSGMPTATNAAMLSMEYGGNEKLASTGVFLTTLFSLGTLPLLIYLLLY